MRTGNHRWPRFAQSLGFALATFATLSTTACYKATFVENKTAAATRPENPTYSKWTHHFLLGLIGSGEYDASEMCPEGTASVQTAGDFSTGVITVATLGVYAPRRVHVTCADPRTASSDEVIR